MNYSTFFCFVMATVGRVDSAEEVPTDTKLEDAIASVQEELLLAVQDFRGKPVTPLAMFEWEGRLKALLREFGRVTLEWTLNHLESSQVSDMPPHVEFDGQLHTRLNRQTPHHIS